MRSPAAEEYDRISGLVPFPAACYRADRDGAVVFWQPSARLWRRMLWTAGFERIDERGHFNLRSPHGFSCAPRRTPRVQALASASANLQYHRYSYTVGI